MKVWTTGVAVACMIALLACGDDGGEEPPVGGVPRADGMERTQVTQTSFIAWNQQGASFGAPSPCELAEVHVGGGAGYFRITQLSVAEESWEVDGLSGSGTALYVEATPLSLQDDPEVDDLGQPVWLRIPNVDRSFEGRLRAPVELSVGRPQVLIYSPPIPENAGFPTVIDDGVLRRAGTGVVTTTGSFTGHRYELPADAFLALLEETWALMDGVGDPLLCPPEALVDPTPLGDRFGF